MSNKKQEKQVKKSGNITSLIVWPLLIAIITFISFSPALEAGFTNWDDPRYVLENPMVRSLDAGNIKQMFKTPVSLNYHPLTILSLAIDYSVDGYNAAVFHRTNLIFHLLTTILVFFFIYLLSGKKIIPAAITSAFFGIHPMHVESVAWIAERKDVLYAFFFVGALITYIKYLKDKQAKWYVAGLLLFVLSLLSKGMAVVLPVVMLLVDWYTGRELKWKLLMEKIPHFVLSLGFGMAAYKIQSAGSIAEFETFSIFQRFMFASYGAMMYLAKMFVPVKLSAFYPYPSLDESGSIPLIFYLSPLIMAALAFGVYKTLKWTRVIAFSFLFYLVTVALVLQFISVGSAIMADRYSYLPYIGTFFAVGMGIQWLWEQRGKNFQSYKWLGTAVVALGAVVFAFKTHARAQVWESSETLWTDVIEKYPQVQVAYKNRGNYYGQNRQLQKAMKDYQSYIQLNPNDANIYINLGNVHGLQGNHQKAIEIYTKALQLDNNDVRVQVQAYMNRANTYGKLGNPQQALSDFQRVDQLLPQLPKDHQYENIVKLHFNRGLTYISVGQFQKAIDDFNTLLKYEPQNLHAWLNRGVAYFQLGNYSQALKDFEQAARINPSYGETYHKISVAYFRMNNFEKALQYAQKAQSLGYNVPGDYLDMVKGRL